MEKEKPRNLEVVIKLTSLESIAEIPQVVEGTEKRRERIEEIRVRGWV